MHRWWISALRNNWAAGCLRHIQMQDLDWGTQVLNQQNKPSSSFLSSINASAN